MQTWQDFKECLDLRAWTDPFVKEGLPAFPQNVFSRSDMQIINNIWPLL